jgi:hypothetical protein
MIESPLLDEIRAEGRAEGEARGRATSVADVLTDRFGAVPAHLQDLIFATRDLDALRRLTRLATACTSLQEFEESL